MTNHYDDATRAKLKAFEGLCDELMLQMYDPHPTPTQAAERTRRRTAHNVALRQANETIGVFGGAQ